MSLNSVVGKSGVPAIFGITSRHMATNAVAIPVRMCSRKFLHMTRKAFGTKVRDGINRLVVRIVARTTPKLSVALACADASGKLLNVTNDFELLSLGSLRQHLAIGSENVLEALAWPEVAELLSRIQHPAGTE